MWKYACPKKGELWNGVSQIFSACKYLAIPRLKVSGTGIHFTVNCIMHFIMTNCKCWWQGSHFARDDYRTMDCCLGTMALKYTQTKNIKCRTSYPYCLLGDWLDYSLARFWSRWPFSMQEREGPPGLHCFQISWGGKMANKRSALWSPTPQPPFRGLPNSCGALYAGRRAWRWMIDFSLCLSPKAICAYSHALLQ